MKLGCEDESGRLWLRYFAWVWRRICLGSCLGHGVMRVETQYRYAGELIWSSKWIWSTDIMIRKKTPEEDWIYKRRLLKKKTGFTFVGVLVEHWISWKFINEFDNYHLVLLFNYQTPHSYQTEWMVWKILWMVWKILWNYMQFFSIAD